MMGAYFLSWLENLALWILWRSPRTGLIIVRQFGTGLTWYCQAPNEQLPHWLVPDDQLPDHFDLERMYHMPSYGEEE